jgi:hypothetical protein
LRHLTRGVFVYDAHTLQEHRPERVHCRDGSNATSRIPTIHSGLYKVPPQSRPVPGHFGSGAAHTVYRGNAEWARRGAAKSSALHSVLCPGRKVPIADVPLGRR